MSLSGTVHLIFSILLLVVITAIKSITVSEAAKVPLEPVISDNDIILTQKIVETEENPVKIFIPKIKVNLDVVMGKIIDGTWDLNDYSALYAEGSSPLSTQYGNSIIYAHSRPGLFGGLKDLEFTDLIFVTGENKTYVYEVISKEHILPNEIEKIKVAGSHQLTLFTCDGPYDKFRLLVKAKKVNEFTGQYDEGF